MGTGAVTYSEAASDAAGRLETAGVPEAKENALLLLEYVCGSRRQDIYLKDARVNKNNLFILSDGEFFELKPGRNTIYFTGLTYGLNITPNWWTV